MFVKLFTQILDSSIADDRRLRHFFTDLLLCADCKGYVLMTPSAIARRIGATQEEVKWGIAELEKPDPRSKTIDNEGRRIERLEGSGYGWMIMNYETYRAMRDADQMREATRIRVQRHREKVKSETLPVTDVTDGNANTEAKADTKAKKNRSITAFEKPTEEMILEYGKTLTPQFKDAIGFLDYYESNGWKVGSSKMKDWKATVRRWTRNQIPKAKSESTSVLQMGLSAISSDFAPAKPQKTVNLAAEMGI